MRPPRPIAALVLAAVCIAAVSAVQIADETVADLQRRSQAALAQIAGDLAVPGLEQPVEVIRDRWGVPHIYAKSSHDLFFAQGYVAAQDRLWQLDLWRRNADGTLAEVVGPSAVRRDTFARLLRYRGDMDAEWRSYSPDAKAIVEAFVAGVNAQIAYVRAHPEKLPIEFQLLDTRPEPWTPEVVIGRMAGYVMTRNARSEIQRARLARSVGAARVAEFMPVEPETPITVPEGLELDDIVDGILDIAADASETVRFPPERLKIAAPPSAMELLRSPVGRATADDRTAPAPAEDDEPWRDAAYAPADADEPWRDTAYAPANADDPWRDTAWKNGSNNWVLAGALTASGKPILANDPHRVIALPSLRYLTHLVGPGWNVIGAGEPALPGVAAGHNDRIAFGFTIVGMDQQDLYVERLDPERPEHILYRGVPEPMRIEREVIKVRGEAPRAVELRFTRHGPVLHRDLARRRAYVLRWVGSEPGTAGYLRSLALNRARTWPEFRAAVAGWKVPSENLIYADVDGNIGWIAAGMAPIRSGWNGLLPVPGDSGRYEWNGAIGIDDLPQAYNPASGFIVTANNNILPPGYPRMLGYEWSAPHRANRITEVVRAAVARGAKLTVADSQRLQHDATSLVARAICTALRAAGEPALAGAAQGRADGGTDDGAKALAMLGGWDHVVDQQSAAAALFEIWMPKLSAAMQRALVTEGDRTFAGESMSSERLIQAVARVPGDARVSALLTGSSLADAWREAAQRMGPDPSRWSWGAIHRVYWEHPIASTPARREVFNLPDAPRSGDATTPLATSAGARQVHGASFREVIDLSGWDRSTAINVPGQSAQPGSPFYGNLRPLWVAEQYHPLAYSRSAVEAQAAARLTLLPVVK
jgi:penicillin amidase